VEKQKRPKILSGKTHKVKTGCGTLYITLNKHKGKLFEIVLPTLGKAGGCATCQNEALTRAVTLGLRYGIPKEEYIQALEGIQCPSPNLFPEEDRVLSCSDALAKILREDE